MLTPQIVGRLIQSSRPRPGLSGNRPLLLALAALLGVILAEPGVGGVGLLLSRLAVQVIFVAIFAIFIYGAWAQRRLSARVAEVFEAVQLQSWERAGLLLEQILAKPVRHPQTRCELLLSLAAAAETRHEYDAAQCVFETILEENRGDALQLHAARVALAATMLRTGQTTDAITLIDRLTKVDVPEPLKAQVELVSLFREIVMGQARDNLEAAGERRRLFREYLSTRAGYGYGLLASAFDVAQRPEEAGRYWHDATLLVRPADLVGRFGELERVAGRYPHAEALL